ncbi:ATP-binding protein [Streptomyces sp. CB03238]|uniref:ATP-binding protein n=1 Tax=Streptomyces sp. CB03238 TaxID=1907777 RepID=UPI000D1A731D|nr:ATP-binding protein [Streptomyces sp. CB03238]
MTLSITEAQPAAVAEARGMARAFLEALEPTVAPEATDTVVLVVSELVTNALRHAGGVCSLRLAARRDAIEVAVADPSPARPRMRTPDLNGGTGGFGWPMVHRLARSVTVTGTGDGGKTVRALLSR